MKLTDTDLLGIIKAHRRDSLGAEDGDLSNQRSKAMDHYHGRPYGTEVEGRSKVVSRDLAETVDWALPSIMRAFIQSGRLGEFDPVGPEDEQMAQQESDYVNQVLMHDNAGFMVLHDVFKDTMLLKNGYVKHFWDVSETVREEDYTGLSIESVAKLLGDLEAEGAEVEITGQEITEVPIPGMPEQNQAQGIMTPGTMVLVDLTLNVKRKKGRVCIMAVPAEEVGVSKRCRGSLQDSPFTEHRTKRTRSELIEMGMPRSFVDDLPACNEGETDSQSRSRDSVDDESDSAGAAHLDKSMDEIDYREAYVRVDCDGDGVAELRKIVTVADRIPPGKDWNEQIEAVPLTGFVMKRVPHRHVGESLDDDLADLQEIKTTLHRQLLDNVYATNNQRTVVNESINLKDLMTNKPGGIVRSMGREPVSGNLMPLVTQSILDKILPAIDYWDKTKEIRTGIRPGSDMDPDMLQEVTKGAFLEHLNRASQKIEMMTRMLAESGVKEMVLQVHGLLIRHQDKARQVQMRGKWVEVNPSEWRERTDLTVRVGLGTGNEEEKRQKLMMLSQLQQGLMMAATQAPPQVYAKMYALFEDMSNAMGFETPEKFAIAPNGPEYQQLQQSKPQQPPDPRMLEVQQKGQQKQAEMQMQMELDRNRQEMEAQQQRARMMMETEMERAKMQMQMELERQKVAMMADVQVQIARIKAEASIDAAQLTAATTLTPQQEQASDSAAGA